MDIYLKETKELRELKEKLCPVLSACARKEADYIYWKHGTNFNCSVNYLTLSQREERRRKICHLQRYLFSCLDGLKEEVLLVSNIEPCEEWEDWNCWFDDFLYYRRSMKTSVFYREIIKEANKRKINLKTTRVIDYRKNKALAERFFRGNMEYISKACFFVPELDFAVQPFHHIELRMLSKNRNDAYLNFAKKILSLDNELEFSLCDL